MSELWVVCISKRFDEVEFAPTMAVGLPIRFKWDADGPERYLPVFESREKAERWRDASAHPDVDILKLVVRNDEGPSEEGPTPEETSGRGIPAAQGEPTTDAAP